MNELYFKPTSSLIVIVFMIVLLETASVMLVHKLMKKGISSRTVLFFEVLAACIIVVIPTLLDKNSRNKLLIDYKKITVLEMIIFIMFSTFGIALIYLSNKVLLYHTASMFRTTEVKAMLLVSGIMFFALGNEVYTTKKLIYFICMGIFAVLATITK